MESKVLVPYLNLQCQSHCIAKFPFLPSSDKEYELTLALLKKKFQVLSAIVLLGFFN